MNFGGGEEPVRRMVEPSTCMGLAASVRLRVPFDVPFRPRRESTRGWERPCRRGLADPEVCEPTPYEHAAAPAVYWPRSSGVRVPGTGAERKNPMSV